MKAEMNADDSEMRTVMRLAQMTVVQLVDHLVMMKVVSWVQMKAEMKADC